MPLRAEWDPLSQVVLAFLDDTDPFRPRQPTGAQPSPGVAPVVLPVQSRYPDPYLATLPDLLGPAVVRWDADANVLIREWPAADYTPDTVRVGLRKLVEWNARQALADTDWAVVRQMETDEPIPADIRTFRGAVRAWTAERKATLVTATAAELLAFDAAPPQKPTAGLTGAP